MVAGNRLRARVAETMLDLRPRVLQERADLYLTAVARRILVLTQPYSCFIEGHDVVDRGIAESIGIQGLSLIDGVRLINDEGGGDRLPDFVHIAREIGDYTQAQNIGDLPERRVVLRRQPQLPLKAVPALDSTLHHMYFVLQVAQSGPQNRLHLRSRALQGVSLGIKASEDLGDGVVAHCAPPASSCHRRLRLRLPAWLPMQPWQLLVLGGSGPARQDRRNTLPVH